MKKLYISATMLMILFSSINVFANGQTPVQDEPVKPTIFESGENNTELPKPQKVQTSYKYLNPDSLDQDLEKNPNLAQLFEQEGDRLLKSDNYEGAKMSMRDKEVAKKTIESYEKKKCNTHIWKLVASAAAGAGSMAVSIALFYLFQKKPSNDEASAAFQAMTEAFRALIPKPDDK